MWSEIFVGLFLSVLTQPEIVMSALPKSNERRKYRRISDAIALHVQQHDATASEAELYVDDLPQHPTHVVSLNPNGLKCYHDKMFNDGDIMALSIRLFPSGERIDTLAKVVNSGEEDQPGKNNRFFAGMAFIKLSDENKALMLEHVKQVARQSFGGSVKLVN